MSTSDGLWFVAVVLTASAALAATEGQSAGNATSLPGTVTDVIGAIVLGATVKIHHPVSGFERTTPPMNGMFLKLNWLVALLVATFCLPLAGHTMFRRVP